MRELFKTIEVRPPSQAFLLFRSSIPLAANVTPLRAWGFRVCRMKPAEPETRSKLSPWPGIQELRSEASHCAQISKNDRRKRARAAKAHRGFNPGSCNGLFSEGFPTGVRGTCLARPYEPALQPASQFPLGAGPKATGKQNCSSPTLKE